MTGMVPLRRGSRGPAGACMVGLAHRRWPEHPASRFPATACRAESRPTERLIGNNPGDRPAGDANPGAGRTWHRPFTTFELAGLQSLVEPEEQLELDGLSDAAWRERIGNAVPPDAAEAIASTMGTTLLLAWSGQGFMLSAVPIWVRPVAVALSVRAGDVA